VKPRIGIVSHFPPPPGGIPILAELFATRLREEGHEVVTIPTNLRGPLMDRVDSTRFVRTLFRAPVFLWRLMIALPKAQVIHTLSYCGLAFFLFTTPAVLLGRLFGKRVVVNYHGGRAERFFARFRPLVRFVLKRANVIAVPSGFLAEIFQRMGFDTVIVPNPCALEGLLKGKGRRVTTPVFLVARNLEPVYNVSCALRAFALIRQQRPDATMVVCGSGTEASKVRQLAHELGISDAVQFPGSIPNSELWKWYERAFAFINSSNADNMPVSIIEAFSASVPVISTRAGGIPFIVEHNATGLLVGLNDHRSLAEQALRLLDDPELVTTLTANGRAAAQAYRWENVYARLFDVYQCVPGGSGPSMVEA
jgi:glycosyltransferase involved in cell wall biosynthesis